jgi:hypothetical protein
MSDSIETKQSIKKDLKNINLILPNNLNEIKPNIDIIINKNEEIIKKYLERIMYTSKIPEEVNIQLNKVFQDVKKNIL